MKQKDAARMLFPETADKFKLCMGNLHLAADNGTRKAISGIQLCHFNRTYPWELDTDPAQSLFRHSVGNLTESVRKLNEIGMIQDTKTGTGRKPWQNYRRITANMEIWILKQGMKHLTVSNWADGSATKVKVKTRIQMNTYRRTAETACRTGHDHRTETQRSGRNISRQPRSISKFMETLK